MLSKKVSNFLSNHSFFRNFDTLIGINSISKPVGGINLVHT